MPDGEYKITVKSEQDGSGIKDTTAELSNLGKQGKASADAIEEGGKKTKKAGEEGAEGMKILGHGAHEAHATLRALSEAIPGLEQVSRFLANGMTAAIGVVLLAFNALKGKVEEFSKTLDDLDSGPGARGEWAEKIRDNAREAAVETAVLEERMQEVITAEETLAHSTQRLIDAQKQQASDQSEVDAAQKELELARLELAEKLGQVTPEQAVRIRLEIDDADFRRQLEAKKAGIKAELDGRLKEGEANNHRWGAAAEKAAKTDDAAQAAKDAADKNAAKLAQDQQNLKESQDTQAKADKVVESLEGHGIWGGNYDKTDPQYFQLQAAKDTQQAEQNRQALLRRSIQQEQGKEIPLAEAAGVAKQQADAAKADYEDAVKTAGEIKQTVAKLQADLAAATAKATALEAIHSQTTSVKEASAHADAQKKLREDVRNGRATGQEQQEWQSQQMQDAYAHEAGPQAAVDANAVITHARLTLETVRHQQGQKPTGEQDAEMHGILSEISGLMVNQAQQLKSQQAALAQVRRDIEEVAQWASQTSAVR